MKKNSFNPKKFYNACFWLIALLILGTVIYWVYTFTRENFELNCILSSVDNNKYCVRDNDRAQQSADLLADATMRMEKLVTHLINAYPNNPVCQRLKKNFDPRKINETLPNSTHVAFSENKQKMSFCLTKEKKETSGLIDINTLMFVSLHEMGHLCTVSIGHKQEFWDNFKFLLVEAEGIGIYIPENYKEEPTEFCSMKINSNPYYDT
jgi:hypothetical protein